MTRVLGIIGSPRRNGNTDILVGRILQGASEAGAYTRRLFLADLELHECDGCHACWKGKSCPKRDDMSGLLPELARSDVLIFGTPVYWYGPTAIMKAFLDRFVYFNCPENRALIRGRSAVLAIPFEEPTGGAADLMVQMFQKSFEYLEMKLAGVILAPGVGDKAAIMNKPQRLQQAYDLGRSLAE